MGKVEKEKSQSKKAASLPLMERYKNRSWTGKEVQKIEKAKGH